MTDSIPTQRSSAAHNPGLAPLCPVLFSNQRISPHQVVHLGVPAEFTHRSLPCPANGDRTIMISSSDNHHKRHSSRVEVGDSISQFSLLRTSTFAQTCVFCLAFGQPVQRQLNAFGQPRRSLQPSSGFGTRFPISKHAPLYDLIPAIIMSLSYAPLRP